MKMFPFCLKEPRDIDTVLTKFRRQCPPKYSSLLCSIYSSTTDPRTNQRLCRSIRNAFPDMTIIGCTSSGEIFDGHIELKTTIVNIMVFETSTVSVKFFDCNNAPLTEASNWVLEQSASDPELRGIGFWTTPPTINDIPVFLDDLRRVPADIKIFGGSADLYLDMTARNERMAAIFTEDCWTTKGILLILFRGKDLHIHISSFLGWKPLGRSVTVTGMKNRRTVTTFDKKPAISLYEKYLGIIPEKDFLQPLITFPVIVNRDGHTIARVPATYEEDGSILFTGDLRMGEHLHLGYGDPQAMRRHLRASYTDIRDFAPQGILLLSCIVRRLYLKEAVHQELEPFKHLAPVAGLYTYGEIRRFDGYTSVHVQNSALMTVSFREGDKPADITTEPVSKTISTDDRLTVVSGLAHFISVTNRELEEANRELRRLANTDRLTNLLNRGATEAMLRDGLDFFNRHPDKHISVAMLDLDYFKRVNDTFGHEEGDRVLKQAALIMQDCIRQSDSAGRWGGKEFMMVLPECTLEDAINIAEHIRQCIKNTIALPDGAPMTASLGVATAVPGDTIDSLYSRLDALLYRAKRKGRNQVCAEIFE